MKREVGMKKKVKKGKDTVVVFILDQTGSMGVCRDATISGFNEYIGTLKKQKGKVLFSLTKFNSERVENTYESTNIKDVQPLNSDTYIPSGMTPLYDAIAKGIKGTKDKGAKDKNVLFVMMTDGEENSSREYKRDDIFKMVKEQESKGWTFVFLGANQDSWATGQSIGLHKGNVMNYDVAQTAQTFANLSSVTMSYCSDGTQSKNFFKKENATN